MTDRKTEGQKTSSPERAAALKMNIGGSIYILKANFSSKLEKLEKVLDSPLKVLFEVTPV